MADIQSQDYPCPACDALAEPEQDGDVLFYKCPECEYEFGWSKLPATVMTSDASGACAIGVPESVRKAFSGPMEQAMSDAEPKGIPVSIGRKRG